MEICKRVCLVVYNNASLGRGAHTNYTTSGYVVAKTCKRTFNSTSITNSNTSNDRSGIHSTENSASNSSKNSIHLRKKFFTPVGKDTFDCWCLQTQRSQNREAQKQSKYGGSVRYVTLPRYVLHLAFQACTSEPMARYLSYYCLHL